MVEEVIGHPRCRIALQGMAVPRVAAGEGTWWQREARIQVHPRTERHAQHQHAHRVWKRQPGEELLHRRTADQNGTEREKQQLVVVVFVSLSANLAVQPVHGGKAVALGRHRLHSRHCEA